MLYRTCLNSLQGFKGIQEDKTISQSSEDVIDRVSLKGSHTLNDSPSVAREAARKKSNVSLDIFRTPQHLQTQFTHFWRKIPATKGLCA